MLIVWIEWLIIAFILFHSMWPQFIRSAVRVEMSPEQQKQLIDIRKKKQELLLEIQVSTMFSIYNTILC